MITIIPVKFISSYVFFRAYFFSVCLYCIFCRQDSELVQNAQLSKAKLLLYLLIL